MTTWQKVDEHTPKEKMLLLTDDNWAPSRLRGDPPPVKIGYYFEEMGVWRIFGASWTPTRWAEIPYPERLEENSK